MALPVSVWIDIDTVIYRLDHFIQINVQALSSASVLPRISIFRVARPMTRCYRPDIDGLRAIAVFAVVLFHFGFEAFSGGYVGVDVFFVISGYLITGLIIDELEAGKFSLLQFYERRCRRILPALLVVLLVTLLAGGLLQFSDDFESTGKSAAAAALFYANVQFNSEMGYFGVAANQKPLLHTWSLAIEEQFYIVFPLLLIVIARYHAQRYALWLVALMLASLVSGLLVLESAASDAFFLSPYRAWELLLGSLVAIGFFPQVGNQRLRLMFSAAGLGLVFASVFCFSEQTPFPGIAALLPTVGTAMILHFGASGTNRVSTLLAARPLVFFGLISYSLYLWHWPVIVYTRYYTILEPGIEIKLICLLVILALAILSWKYIEQPVRKRVVWPHRQRLFGVSVTGILLVFLMGTTVSYNAGFPSRYQHLAGEVRQGEDPVWEYWKSCGEAIERLGRRQALCAIGDKEVAADFLVWGDSHARAMAHGIDLGAQAAGKGGVIAYQSGCPVLISVARQDRSNCVEFSENLLQYLAERPQLKTVVIVARWPVWATGTRYKNEAGRSIRLTTPQLAGQGDLTNLEIFAAGLKRTVATLKDMGRQVVLVKSVPEIGYESPSINFVASITGRDTNTLIAPSVEEFAERTRDVNRILAELEKSGQVQIVDPTPILCDSRQCNVVVDGKLLYRDDDHLSSVGSALLAGLFTDLPGKL